MASPKKAPRKRAGRTVTGDELARRLSGESMRFPEAGPRPRWDHAPRDEQERARMQDELYDWSMRDLISQAVHTNDPDARVRLARGLADRLIAGHLPTATERQWIAWVLTRLVATDSVPHLSRGNAIKSGARRDTTVELVHLIAQASSSKRGITKRLADAAKLLNISYPKAREFYYSDLGQTYAAMLAESVQRSKKRPPE